MQDRSSASLARRLEEVGLNSKEAKVYLAALRLGPSNVQKLAAAASLSRTSVYPVLEALRTSGLMSTTVAGMKRLFSAEPPAKLEAIIEAKRALIQSILPDLEASRKHLPSSDRIKEYTGRPAVRTAYEELLEGTKPGDEYIVCSELEKWMSLDPLFFTEFRRRRDRMLLEIKILATDTAVSRSLKASAKGRAEIRFLPKGTPLATNVVVVPNRVLIHRVHNPPSAVVLFDDSIIMLHQQLLRIIWGTLPR